MNLYKGMLCQSNDGEGKNLTERVIAIDEANSDVITIDIFHQRALPSRISISDLEAALASGHTRILTEDPHEHLRRPEKEIKKKHRSIRDKSYELISSLVERDDGEMFDPQTRGQLIKALSRTTGKPQSTIYDLLRRFWQRGLMKNALLPAYQQRGWRNRDPNRQRKTPKNSNRQRPLNVQGQIKVGRGSKLARHTGSPRGINVFEDTRKKFRWGIKLFFETREARTLKDAYQQTLERFFNKGFYQNQDGTPEPALPPAHELPSYSQFTYWYRKERKPKRASISRHGDSRHNLSHREILGDASQMAVGPGSISQIDATLGDIYLVSSLDRTRIIGRPVIYVVIDTFSHMITGISVSLEGPSWVGAMVAIENSTVDKVAFCKEYGITIEHEDWPSCNFPEGFLADRGELEGYNADNLVNAFNCRMHNTAPYRGDWKSIVEQQIDLCNERLIHWIPGAVRTRERGDKDYRLDAVLDLHQFRKLMITCVLYHNNQHRMEKYRKDEYMIADHVEPYPLDLWNWGIENRSGHLREMSQETVRMNLLPEFDVAVTPRGLRFNGLYYSCHRAIEEQWFMRERRKRINYLKAVADPRDLSQIHLRLDSGQRLETCHLVDADKTFMKRDLYEALEYFELCKLKKESSLTRQLQSRANFNAARNKIVAQAKQQTATALAESGKSNRSRIKGIRANRALERELERQTDAWQFNDSQGADDSTLISPHSLHSNPTEGYVAPRQPMDKLRQIRERRLLK